MPNTFEIISSVSVGAGGAATINFSSIPSTYTDLCLKVSCRTNTTGGGNGFLMSFNGSSSSFTARSIMGNAAGTYSYSYTTGFAGFVNGTTEPTGYFAPTTLYIPNYASSNYKSYSSDTSMWNYSSNYYLVLLGGLWSNTAAINQITLTPQAGSFVQHSTAYLYGIKNS